MSLFALVIGCSRGPTVAGTGTPEVTLCAPWSGWRLPLPLGSSSGTPELRVVACDERRLAIRAPAGSAGRLSVAWREALRADWVEDLESADPGPPAMVAVRYSGASGAGLDLSVIDDQGHTQIVLVRSSP